MIMIMAAMIRKRELVERAGLEFLFHNDDESKSGVFKKMMTIIIVMKMMMIMMTAWLQLGSCFCVI